MRFKAVQDGEGLEAYRLIHTWFTMTTGLGLAERRMKIMMPERALKDEEIVGKIESCYRELRELSEIDSDELKLPDGYKRTALKCILTAEAMRHFSTREEEYSTYGGFRGAIMAWAMRRRLEVNRETHAMDIGQATGGGHGCTHSHQETQLWEPMEYQYWEQGGIDAMGKGKAMGKGGKPIQFQGNCHNCG